VTQVLGFLCNRFIIQVSDRRLTRPDGGLYDDHTNKCVFFDARASFSYTGLAEIEGEPTYVWLAKVLSEQRASDLKTTGEHLAARATTAFRRMRIPRKWRQTTFAAVAWAFPRDRPEPTPVDVRVSNVANGILREYFQLDIRAIGPKGPARILSVAGVPLSLAARDRLDAVLRHHMRHKADVQIVVESLVRAVRQAADADTRGRIGRRLLSAVIPREAVETRGSTDLQIVVTGPAGDEVVLPTFQLWEDGVWNGITYGPSFASPGGSVVVDFKSGPILPSLGGLKGGPGGKLTVTYPMAILHGPENGFVSTTVKGHTYMAAFSDTRLMEAFIHEESPGARPLRINTPHELREVLQVLAASVEFLLFNPNGDANQRVPVAIAEILASLSSQ
jgi:hypothetical protein